MLLSKLVSSILNDLTTAQDLANEYSSQLSHKYKKFEDGKENTLSNFQVPVGMLQAIEFDLKFAIQTLEDSSTLDIEQTRHNCDEIARKAVKQAIEAVITFMGELGITNRIPETETRQITTVAPLVSRTESESSISNEEKKRRDVINFWQSVKENMRDRRFAKFLQKIIAQELFERGKNLYLRNSRVTEANVKEIIADKLEDGVIGHEDIQELLEQTQEIFNRDTEEIRSRLRQLFNEVANSVVSRRETKELITLMPGGSNANIIVNPTELKELPPEMISSLRIKAQLDNYRWMISESSQSLQKVQE
ncbi:hypothetical protein [Trichormus variabilis]|uniref:Uncharacterized protein n=1 Tax=Trichormus variabilis SAG 1403-4b TaxID=447716 RepID=A0A3S1C1Z1_ANAVA|nr:hypothetical protein [Trichormus variabilis]MBD2629252.1 hypothetical protein [Trichormus variabilis FACHB-164]RUS93824.1 hypothetical protein DSM107003_40600 [Trichormus variabilis SAG 1403-4b]